MSLDLDQLEAEAKGIQFGTRSADTILSLISELREYKAANKSLQLQVQLAGQWRPSDFIFLGLEERLQSAEEALRFYADGENYSEESIKITEKARAHFEKYGEKTTIEFPNGSKIHFDSSLKDPLQGTDGKE